ncbi:glycine cleavage system protein GcvH [Kitasatospora sp. NPDC089797]|uniref:glycine cleavage system protein GcvH n=1 Tax=Kitasatospora sp. NPDC089797 TaxID=3155298 RepID=UPI003437641A
MAYPKDFKYTKDHEWVQPTGKSRARVGITEYAQNQLGDIVFVELPKVGAAFEVGRPFGTVESVKSVSELYAPVSGKVAAVNEELNDAPEDINHDPHGDGWMVEVDLAEPAELDALLTAAQYEAYLKEESAG